jgi:DNA-binding NtrC family response regulator
MKSYDGEIVVSSELGEGATFRLYFPVTDLAVVDEGAAEVPLPRGDGQHILFVDDEASLVAWGIGVLERLGYRVTGHTRVADALAAVNEDPDAFDLVLTDMTMPVMTGIQFAQRVRGIRPDLPVILTTGYSPSATSAVHQDGIARLLVKPIALSTLAQAVDRALREEE